MRVFNTLTKQLEEVVPLEEGHLKFFVCGPTVYGPTHAGHAKTYTQFDFIAKVFRQRFPKVTYIQNITDVDDKIIKKARTEGKTPQEVALFWEEHFKAVMKELGNEQVDAWHRAHDHIPEVISQVERLLALEKAYSVPEEGIYFDLASFPDYGSLAKRKFDEEDASRVDHSFKRSPGDFVIWKFSKQGDPVWEAPFGAGRPGWHIEDTAITEKYLGSSYDVHGGATDLIFPHHEAEIAQMEAITGKPLVSYWLHTGLLSVEGTKMGKSLNNFVTVEDLLSRWSPKTLRYAFLSTHYRSSMEINDEVLKAAETARERVEVFYREQASDKDFSDDLWVDFLSAIYEDFNTSKALAVIFTAIRETPGLVTKELLEEVNKLFGGVFDFTQPEPPEAVKNLAALRLQARSDRKWSEADSLREEVEALGWAIKDNSSGYILTSKRIEVS